MKKTSLTFYSLLGLMFAVLTAIVISCDKNNGIDPGKHSNCPDANTIIESWPATSKRVAEEVMAKYGQPNGRTQAMLVWNNNGPWKRTIVYRDTIPHNFPTPHPDLLQQFINYKTPLGKFDDLARYDGSVIVERTKGEISARCDKEGANFLALNLANDVATGAKTVEQARDYYTRAMKTFKTTGQMDPYMKEFKFSVPTGGTNDPDIKRF